MNALAPTSQETYAILCPECGNSAQRSPQGQESCEHCGYDAETPPDSYVMLEELTPQVEA